MQEKCSLICTRDIRGLVARRDHLVQSSLGLHAERTKLVSRLDELLLERAAVDERLTNLQQDVKASEANKPAPSAQIREYV